MSELSDKVTPDLKAFLVSLTENFSEKLMIILVERLGGSLTVTEKELDIDNPSNKVIVMIHKGTIFNIWVEDKPC
jgi:hypothetical protein